MWDAEPIPEGDSLRQGDLLDEVIFPMTKVPIQPVKIEGAEGVLVPAKRKFGLVVSQCCDNGANDYAVIAHVQTVAGLQEHQEQALFNYDPNPDQLQDYVLDTFRLEPIQGLLDAKPKSHWAALLTRTTTFWGNGCADLIDRRVARMTAESRRWLRINLSLFWGRAEQGDRELLMAQGLPEGIKGQG